MSTVEKTPTGFRAVLAASIRDFYDEMLVMVAANLVWFFLSILVLPFPPLTFGVFYMTNQVAHGRIPRVGMVFEGARRYLLKSWQVAIATLVIVGLLWVNIVFYGRFNTMPARIVQLVWFYVLLFWLLSQLYVLPLLLEMESPRLLLAYRNAALLVLANPGFTLLMALTMLSILGISVALGLPIAALTMSALALLSNRGLLAVIARYRDQQEVQREE